MKGLLLDATENVAEVFRTMRREGSPAINVTIKIQVVPGDQPTMLPGYDFVLDDHTVLLDRPPAGGGLRCACRVAPLGGTGVGCAKLVACVGVAEW